MIQVKDLCFSYGRTPVLERVSFQAEPGTCTAVLGNNGAGKSTLITCMNRVRTPAGGCVLVDGRDVLGLRRDQAARLVAYGAQKSELGHVTVYDAVLLGRRPYLRWNLTEQDHAMVRKALERLDLISYALRYLDELSGGELQKVMLARALVQEPRLLLLDEPTSSLDPKNQHEVLALVRQVAKERQIAVLVILHDLNLALRYCNQFLFLKEGRIFAQGGREVMNPETIQAVYGMQVHVCTVDNVPVVIPCA